MMSRTISVSHVICDILLLLCFGVPIIILKVWGKPHKRGFYCNDDTIRYPYRDSTVSSQVLLVITLPLPILLIFTTEIIRVTIWANRSGNTCTFRLGRFLLPLVIVRLYGIIGCFILGLCFESLLTNIAKYTVGRHRPHFMDVCRPNIGYQECSYPLLYITDFVCTGTRQDLFLDSQLSFFSGHSARSFYTATYLALYFRVSLSQMPVPRLLLPAIQFLLIGGAFYVALTRVSDYKHHWSDVLAGIVIGSLIGVFVALFMARLTKVSNGVLSNKHNLNNRSEERTPVSPNTETSAIESFTFANEHERSSNQRQASGASPIENMQTLRLYHATPVTTVL